MSSYVKLDLQSQKPELTNYSAAFLKPCIPYSYTISENELWPLRLRWIFKTLIDIVNMIIFFFTNSSAPLDDCLPCSMYLKLRKFMTILSKWLDYNFFILSGRVSSAPKTKIYQSCFLRSVILVLLVTKLLYSLVSPYLKSWAIYQQLWSFLVLCKILCLWRLPNQCPKREILILRKDVLM